MRSSRGRQLLKASLLAGIAALSLPPAHATEGEEPEFSTTRSLVGSYLAGRFARASNDASKAAEFYSNALALDPKNEQLLDQAFQMECSQANWPRALKLAGDLVALQPQHRIAGLALAVDAFKNGNLKEAEERLKAAGTGPIGELTSSLALAWVKLAEKDGPGALAQLDMPRQAEWAQFFLRYHKALIADLVGRRQDAKLAYEKAFKQDTRTLRTAIAYARHAANGGDKKLALSILKDHIEKSQGDGHPLLRSLRDEVQAGAKVDLIVTNPSEGVAEVLYGLGEALIGEGALGIGILYMQMALHVVPEQQFALASLANAYETNKQFTEAITTYDRIPADSPLAFAIQIRKAYNLNSLEKTDEARDVLTKLLEAPAAEPPAAPAVTPPSPPAAPPTTAEGEVLKFGDQGDRVTRLQEKLAELQLGPGKPDGNYGDDTRRAVRTFQSKNGIEADGIAGPVTLAAIFGSGSAAGELAQGPVTPPAKPGQSVNERLEILDTLGTIMRSRKRYAEAVEYYDQAIKLISKPEKRHWAFYYARGTSQERLKNWPAAEVDLEKALALYPDQPLVLNYLGYSWIDQGHNLKEGMAHIEKAVALKPDDGYIVDSLGWAHFKQGNYKEAVRYLERAVELKPDDPVLNDHLGDALWRVGREREARFQWDQALSLNPEPEDAEKIKTKLQHGMSAEDPKAAASKTKQAAQGEQRSN